MALIKCKECGKEKSSQAKVCPHCGLKKRGLIMKLIRFSWQISLGCIAFIVVIALFH
jgi:ribosomal protein L37E